MTRPPAGPEFVPKAGERVLATLNVDGSRRWLNPRPSPGRHFRRRRVLAWVLMLTFVVLPHLRMNGRPLVLLDLPAREFTLFGTTFLPTETLLFMLLFVSLAILVFLVTALVGRVWCGWACPQTVYLEFLFRPIERLFNGGWRNTGAAAAVRPRAWKRPAKWAVFLVLSAVLAHTFLAYFVGVERMAEWMRRSPIEHPVTFLIMLGTTAMVFLDFTWFREQTCLVACPYGRLQSALLDRQSLIVGYDTRRGEPRMKGVKARPAVAGDCIDCGSCVITCPTGIDIRDGLQMECIHCTQCVDACDTVMLKIGKPPGLIRYSSRDELERGVRRLLRPRVVLYPLALAITLGLFGFELAHRADSEVTVMRGLDTPFRLADGGTILNQVRIKIANRGRTAHAYRIVLEGAPGARLIAPFNPLEVAGGEHRTTAVFVQMPMAAFHDGRCEIRVRVDDGGRFVADIPWRLVGPERESSPGGTGEREHDK